MKYKIYQAVICLVGQKDNKESHENIFVVAESMLKVAEILNVETPENKELLTIVCLADTCYVQCKK